MIKHVLVAVDGSPYSMSALRYGLDIAEKGGASLEALFVVDRRKTQMPYMYTGGAYDISYERIYIPPDPQLKEFYERIGNDLRVFGEKIIEQCKQEVGQRGENAEYKRDMVGSTTEDLVRRSVRPVMVCPLETWSIDRILFPYDGSRSAENALRFYIHAFKDFARELVMLSAEASDAEIASIEEEKRFLQEHGIEPRIVRTEGPPVEKVLSVAKSEKSDMIMIGSHGRNKIVDYILGSTTAHVLRKSEVPVLIVY